MANNDISTRYLANKFRGLVSPIKKGNYSHAPVLQDSIAIGEAGDYYTKCKFWVHEPTERYEQYGIFLSFSNGNASTFSRIKGLEEIDRIIQFLSENRQKLEAMLPLLEQKQKDIVVARKTAQDQLELLRALAASNQELPDNELVDTESIDYEQLEKILPKE